MNSNLNECYILHYNFVEQKKKKILLSAIALLYNVK